MRLQLLEENCTYINDRTGIKSFADAVSKGGIARSILLDRAFLSEPGFGEIKDLQDKHCLISLIT